MTWWQIFIAPRLLMFDTMCAGILHDRDECLPVTRRLPLIGRTSHVFYPRAASFGTAHRKHKHTLRAGTLADMTTETYSAVRPHYPAWSWWDYQVRGRLRFVFSSGEIVTHLFCLLIVNLIWLQVNESDADDQDFGDYALDFMAGEQSEFTS